MMRIILISDLVKKTKFNFISDDNNKKEVEIIFKKDNNLDSTEKPKTNTW